MDGRKMKKKIEKDFAAAYDQHADAIFRHCYTRTGNRALARDLTQETFLRAWGSVAEGAAIDNLRAFLYRIATNAVIDHVRKAKEYSLDFMMEEGFDPASRGHQAIAAKAEYGDFMRALTQLDDTHKTAVSMRLIDDMSPREIAKILNEPENTVSVRIHRGIKKLKELLSQPNTI
jgi:RNA polymerase sigma-70 factor (ECF subfamily)